MSARKAAKAVTVRQEFVAPWGRKADDLPALSTPIAAELRLACEVTISYGIDWDTDWVWYTRRADYDELWQGEPRHVMQCVARMRAAADGDGDRAACLRLMELLLRAEWGYTSTDSVTRAGLVTRGDLQALRERLRAERDAAEQEARRLYGDAPLVQMAEKLGLLPRPSGGSAPSWMANCPGVSHWLMLQAQSGEWGCGWCRRKGGPAELEAFVQERRKRVR